MALINADRVLETSTTTGTGAFDLLGAVTGFQAFSAVCATSDTCYYSIYAVNASGVPSGEWETGLGTYSAASQLTRTTPAESSNAGAAVNFSAGTKYVMIGPIASAAPTPPLADPNADRIQFWDDSAGALAWLTPGSSLPISTTTINVRESLAIAASDETSDLTVGTSKVTFRMPYAFTLTAVRASVKTAPTGSTIIVDINEGGTTILSTKLTIDASETTSTTAATPAVISDTALADDAEITIDIDQIGSSTAGVGLKVVLIGYQT